MRRKHRGQTPPGIFRRFASTAHPHSTVRQSDSPTSAVLQCPRTECRFAIPGVPCNTFAAHPAAPLGSRAAKRRPMGFALCHPPLPPPPQVCGGEKRASPLQACVKCVFGVFQGGLRVVLCRGCVISGDAKVQRYRQSRQCPPGWSGVLSPLHPGGQRIQQRTGRRSAALSVRCRRILASASTNTNQQERKQTK